MMRKLFLGKPIHWLVIAIAFGVLWWMGEALLQTRDFKLFLAILLLLSAAAVVAILLTTRRGEQVTREPVEDE